MSAWQSVVERLVEHLPTLPGWGEVEVFDGPRLDQVDPPSFVTVGYVEGEEIGGSFEQTTPEPWMWEENGLVRSELVTWSGDDGQGEVRARAFALVQTWQDWVNSDHTLGILSPSSTATLTVDVQPIQNTSGAAQRLTVTLNYLARP